MDLQTNIDQWIFISQYFILLKISTNLKKNKKTNGCEYLLVNFITNLVSVSISHNQKVIYLLCEIIFFVDNIYR